MKKNNWERSQEVIVYPAPTLEPEGNYGAKGKGQAFKAKGKEMDAKLPPACTDKECGCDWEYGHRL